MRSITHKTYTLRKARAEATVSVSDPATVQRVRDRKVPKGDVLEFARAAGLLALKRTSEVIPDCHPLPIEFGEFRFELLDRQIRIEAEVHAIYRTGVEVEAMHGVMIAALTLYDMLKPIDSEISIESTRLLSKSGGQAKPGASRTGEPFETAVIVCSDSVHAGRAQDSSGAAIATRLKEFGVDSVPVSIVPDEILAIQGQVQKSIRAGVRVIFLTGGTGASPRDVTPEALSTLIDLPLPGILEAARAHGQERTPLAMLSRGVAGFCGETLLVPLPGSQKGAMESLDAIFPHVFHLLEVRTGSRHGS